LLLCRLSPRKLCAAAGPLGICPPAARQAPAGTEDQGWVAHFVLQALGNRCITICGDGRQVRDLLHVDDLVTAMMTAHEQIERVSGQAFNIGGGVANAVSLHDVLAHLERLSGQRPPLRYTEARPADQRYYVSDTRAFSAATGWRPRIGVPEGLRRLLVELAPEAPALGAEGAPPPDPGEVASAGGGLS
jgi:CDP-paratose 2-epimerase